MLPYGPTIAEHVLLDAGLDPSMKLKPLPKEAGGDGGGGGGVHGDGGTDREVNGSMAEDEEEGEAGCLKGGEGDGVGVGEEVGEAEDKVAEAAEEVGGGGKGGKKKGKVPGPVTAEQRAAWKMIGTEELEALHAGLKRLDAWFAGGYECVCFYIKIMGGGLITVCMLCVCFFILRHWVEGWLLHVGLKRLGVWFAAGYVHVCVSVCVLFVCIRVSMCFFDT